MKAHARNATGVYPSEFFAMHAEDSRRSAAEVVPLVLSLLPMQSVVDVGCGTGGWSAEFMVHGVADIWGIDGDYVDRSQLQIPEGRFLPRDLGQTIQLDRRFDLAVCLEVAEHLPESRAAGLVSDLVALAPCVLFSAAVPDQGGTGHINEQFLPYWVELFRNAGYRGIDPLRPRILGNAAVKWYYQQNMVMFVEPKHALLARNFPTPQTIIHQWLYELTMQPPTLRKALRALPGAVLRSFRHRMQLRQKSGGER